MLSDDRSAFVSLRDSWVFVFRSNIITLFHKTRSTECVDWSTYITHFIRLIDSTYCKIPFSFSVGVELNATLLTNARRIVVIDDAGCTMDVERAIEYRTPYAFCSYWRSSQPSRTMRDKECIPRILSDRMLRWLESDWLLVSLAKTRFDVTRKWNTKQQQTPGPDASDRRTKDIVKKVQYSVHVPVVPAANERETALTLILSFPLFRRHGTLRRLFHSFVFFSHGEFRFLLHRPKELSNH
jgi:hypothetical protein